MVYRGRPSQACGRCRTRRLKVCYALEQWLTQLLNCQCDLQKDCCGQCVRAKVDCPGYQDAKKLRIQDETQDVVVKAMKRSKELRYLPLAIDFQAQEAFFGHYGSEGAKCWKFLGQFYRAPDTPTHVLLAIEAAGLAYLWHKNYSETVLITARKRYIQTLKLVNNMLRSGQDVSKSTALMTFLLLDISEKILNSGPGSSPASSSHVTGSFTLVKWQGVEMFRGNNELQLLSRLIQHYITSCVANATPVPDEMSDIRTYLGKRLDTPDYKLQMSGVMIRYARFRSEALNGMFTGTQQYEQAKELDKEIESLLSCMPSSWQYTVKYLETASTRSFGVFSEIHVHRNTCQAWNILRSIRISLNETIIQLSPSLAITDDYLETTVAETNMHMLARDICASVPQYTSCHEVSRQRGLEMSPTCNHIHTSGQQADCYSLILPLYSVGRFANAVTRPWALQQLHYIGSHFCIRNAEFVAQLLERGTDASIWKIYNLLGCYAFNA